ncbi:Pentatricopeptide repeat-containing protein [Rhynchospora pubera]|uniref:Pentatricopeptide repeat-containing protein n=1 Tax=Rhynchospora pubera TaxID=906938 RepID=A0AAV8HQZ9_9POAL|nr:Pentatricopeptide repeat-containing protein [Rhynchospora pubera]
MSYEMEFNLAKVLPLPSVQNRIFRAQILTRLLQKCISDRTHHLHLAPIHAQLIISGLNSNIFLNNLLLNGYTKLGRVDTARKLFDGMTERNKISWSSMISLCTNQGKEEMALSLFSSYLKHSGGTTNEYILSSVLRSCVQLKDVSSALQVHNLAVKLGFDTYDFVGTTLINFYVNFGTMDEALYVFNEMPVKSSATWTAVITGYIRTGNSYLALKCFSLMRNEPLKPDKFILASAISACTALNFLKGGSQIHGYMYRNGIEMDISVENTLIALYSKCDRLESAQRLFDFMHVKNLVSWTTLIAGYMQTSSDLMAMSLFSEMTQLGLQPDSFACTSILCCCGSLKALTQGKQVHCYTIKADLDSDGYVKNALIDMYCKCSSLTDARLVFDCFAKGSTVSYNAMIEGYSVHGEIKEVVRLFNSMRSRSVSPSILTFVSILGVSSEALSFNLCRQIHSIVVKTGILSNLSIGSALIDVYAKCGFTSDARLVFDLIAEPDLVITNAIILGYTGNSQNKEALRLFQHLWVNGFTPDKLTFASLITAASNLTSIFNGLQLHSLVIKFGLSLDPHILSALIDLYGKCGCAKEACVLFSSTRTTDVVCWNSMISTYAQNGQAEESIRVFNLMREENLNPNYITFVGILTACAHAGLVELGLCHYKSMKEKYNIEPRLEHHSSIVNLFGRLGRLNEAKDFIEQLPVEPAPVLWKSLLSACRVFGNVEIGEHAADKILMMDPADSGVYPLLSSIYASKDMWDDVARLRKFLNLNFQILRKKEPGYSVIEVMKRIPVSDSDLLEVGHAWYRK